MDEILLEESVAAAGLSRKKIQAVFEESEPWRTYAEFAARRLKEKYFSDEDYWPHHECKESIVLHYDRPVRFTLRMDSRIADLLISKKIAKLGGKSFRQVFLASLEDRSGDFLDDRFDEGVDSAPVKLLNVLADDIFDRG